MEVKAGPVAHWSSSQAKRRRPWGPGGIGRKWVWGPPSAGPEKEKGYFRQRELVGTSLEAGDRERVC